VGVFLSIKQLEVRKIQFCEDFSPGKIDFLDDSVRQSGIMHSEGEAELLSEELGEIRIWGRVQVEMEGNCDRCLEPMHYPLDSTFDLNYRPAVLEGEDLPKEAAINAGETEVSFYEGNGIELAEVLREYILLCLPMQRVCREDCKGICQECGQNRNLGNCHCEAKPVDSRWAALREVKESLRAK
jgi:uncharacterized protein